MWKALYLFANGADKEAAAYFGEGMPSDWNRWKSLEQTSVTRTELLSRVISGQTDLPSLCRRQLIDVEPFTGGVCNFIIGRFEHAQSYFERAKTKSNAAVFMYLGHIASIKGNNQDALQNYRAAIEVSSRYSDKSKDSKNIIRLGSYLGIYRLAQEGERAALGKVIARIKKKLTFGLPNGLMLP